jgi:phosphatidylserine/phosphatidylglycerophosphate/cardiolipin synthase-like enzyme
MNHSKLIIVDGKLACVGSQNIDSFSFNHLAEAGICFTDIEMIKEIEVIVRKWKTESIEFKGKLHFTFFDKMFSYAFRFFYQIF